MFQKYSKFCFLLCLLCIFSCKKDGITFSDIPNLSLLKDVEVFQLNGTDSLVKIYLHYTDGDGDIGLDPDDTSAPFNIGAPFFYNLFVQVYRVDNGVVSPVLIPSTTDSVNFNDRIPNITPSGKKKSIFGDLTLNLRAMPFPGVKPDSMFYTIQIADRKLHLSTLVKTPVRKFVF